MSSTEHLLIWRQASKHVRSGINCWFPTNRCINKRQKEHSCKLESPHTFDQALLHSNKCRNSWKKWNNKVQTCPESPPKTNNLFLGLWSTKWHYICKELANNAHRGKIFSQFICPKKTKLAPKKIKRAKKTFICHLWQCVCIYCAFKHICYCVMSLTRPCTFLKQHGASLSSLIGSFSVHPFFCLSFIFFINDPSINCDW